jgi:hypothetical protein
MSKRGRFVARLLAAGCGAAADPVRSPTDEKAAPARAAVGYRLAVDTGDGAGGFRASRLLHVASVGRQLAAVS